MSELTWQIRQDHPSVDFGFAVIHEILRVVREQVPELSDLFPFKGPAWECKHVIGTGWAAFRLSDMPGVQVPSVDTLEDNLTKVLRQAIEPFVVEDHEHVAARLGSDWFSFDRFTYVGPYEGGRLSWPHIVEHLVAWMNKQVLPVVMEHNRMRVLRAMPRPPQFDPERILDALVVLECEESIRQGTGFLLEGIGFVTCHHVLGPRTEAFLPTPPFTRHPVRVVAANPTLDLALVSIDGAIDRRPLIRGSADQLGLMAHMAVAGFPNFRYGDSGIIVPGLVVGFRPVSGVRRLLTNAGIVAGMSGGPVLSNNHTVIGIAVTGANRMETVTGTEDHGVIPIEALSLLLAT